MDHSAKRGRRRRERRRELARVASRFF